MPGGQAPGGDFSTPRWARYRRSRGQTVALTSPDALRRLRDGRMSQRQLAAAAGCHPSMIGHLEGGTRDTVSRELAEAITEALDVKFDELWQPSGDGSGA